jgi:hypothetical protein
MLGIGFSLEYFYFYFTFPAASLAKSYSNVFYTETNYFANHLEHYGLDVI